jgi:hypothetical protein
MGSNIVEAKREVRTTFKLRKDEFFAERDLPEKYVGTLIVLDRLATMFAKDSKTYRYDPEAVAAVQFTAQQAVAAFEKNKDEKPKLRKAYLPKVFRHLMVQVNRNHGSKDGMISALLEFLENDRLVSMLDEALGG